MSLLINDYPIIVSPKLAAIIGLNEAILLQQIHYWLGKSTTEAYGAKWVYNTNDDWSKQLPFMSPRTVRRSVDRLRELNLIQTAKHISGSKFDHVYFYTINYSAVENVAIEAAKMATSTTGQNELPEAAKMATSYIDNSTYITKDILEENSAEDDYIVGTMPLKNGQDYQLRDSLVKYFEKEYPELDVFYQLKEMKNWLMFNQEKRKTEKGMPRFINGWLSRARQKQKGESK